MARLSRMLAEFLKRSACQHIKIGCYSTTLLYSSSKYLIRKGMTYLFKGEKEQQKIIVNNRYRGCLIIIWTGLISKIKKGIVQKVYEWPSWYFAKMILLLGDHFGKRIFSVESLVFSLWPIQRIGQMFAKLLKSIVHIPINNFLIAKP